MTVMRAMVLDRAKVPLVMRERPVPVAGAGELLIEVKACGVCRTDLHVRRRRIGTPQAAARAGP